MEKIRLAIVGCTGMAGREAILHQYHLDVIGKQYAELTCVTGSSHSARKQIGDVFRERESKLAERYQFWKPQKCPESLGGMVI